MNIIFRTDASLQIGTGHVMRCLTLADALKGEGANCRFICRQHRGNLIEQIRKRGFEVEILPLDTAEVGANDWPTEAHSNYDAWLGVDWTIDAAQTMGCAGTTTFEWLIVDHYSLDYRWEQSVRPMCRKLMVIDDIADRSHDCEVLLDQNLGRTAGDYRRLVPQRCNILVGPRYALLRPEFLTLRDESLHRRVKPQIRRLLVTMGGIDQADATTKVLEVLPFCPLPADLHIIVVMGQQSPWLEHVQSFAERMSQSIDVVIGVGNMARLMTDSDLAIGAAGSTSWERCCLGLPSIISVQAPNQKAIANALVASGAVKSFEIGASILTLPAAILEIQNSRDNIQMMSMAASKVVDGRGVARVLTELCPMRLA